MQRVCHKLNCVAPTVTCGGALATIACASGSCLEFEWTGLCCRSMHAHKHARTLFCVSDFDPLLMRLAWGSGEGAIVDSEKADARHRSLGRVFAIGARGRSIGRPTDVSRYTSALSEQLSATGVSSVQRQHEVRGAAMHAPSASSRITCSSSIVLRTGRDCCETSQ